jgi:preprotein translocase subunit SecG
MEFFQGLLMTLIIVISLFLIVLVMVQRGKGGGLAGAFGGMGGQSAFGTKAGDLFTRITIGVAAGWILLLIITVKVVNSNSQGPLNVGNGTEVKQSAPAAAGEEKKKDEGNSTTPANNEPAKEESK